MTEPVEVNVCEYAETALEHYMKKCFNLEEENKELKAQIKKLLRMIE
jgi:prefoldin subunit 5